MSSAGLPEPPPLPGGYRPGDRVRIPEGMFAGMVGVVLGPDPGPPLQPAVLVRLRIYERDVDVVLDVVQIAPAPPVG